VVETPDSIREELDEDEELFDEGTPFEVETDETPVGLDDEEAADLDIGSDLQQTADNIADGDHGLDWDMSGILPSAPSDAGDNDDAAGPDGFDPTIGVSQLQSENLDDASLGFEGMETLLVPDLADWRGDEKEQVLFDDRELELPDESNIKDAPTLWSACFEQPGRFEALAATERQLFVGGAELIVFDEGELRAVPCPSGLTRVRAFGGSPARVLGTTKSGVLLDFPAPHYAHPTLLDTTATREPRDEGRRAPTIVTWSDAACVVLTGAGRLLRLCPSDSAGGGSLRTEPLAAEHPIVKLPLDADRPLVLVQSERGLSLGETDDACATAWRTTPLATRWAKSLAEDPFEFAVQGPYVVFAGSRIGVVVLDTRVQSFQRVPGCVAVAALAAGRHAGQPRFWVALNHEIAGRTDLVQIDPTTATAARVASTETVFDDEFAPARALAWAPRGRILYVAGDFGVRGFHIQS